MAHSINSKLVLGSEYLEGEHALLGDSLDGSIGANLTLAIDTLVLPHLYGSGILDNLNYVLETVADDPIFVYLNRNNVVYLKLKKNGVLQSLALITRIRLILTPHLEFDSSIHTTVFDWTTSTTEMEISLGLQNIPEGMYNEAQLVLYDTRKTSGIVWTKLDIVIQSGMIS